MCTPKCPLEVSTTSSEVLCDRKIRWLLELCMVTHHMLWRFYDGAYSFCAANDSISNSYVLMLGWVHHSKEGY